MTIGDPQRYGCPGGRFSTCACTGECRIPPEERDAWRGNRNRQPKLEDENGDSMHTLHYRGFHLVLGEKLTSEEEMELKKLLDSMRERRKPPTA